MDHHKLTLLVREARNDKPLFADRSGSGTVRDKGSKKTVAASVNETPCFSRFEAALAGSHSNSVDTPMKIYDCDQKEHVELLLISPAILQ